MNFDLARVAPLLLMAAFVLYAPLGMSLFYNPLIDGRLTSSPIPIFFAYALQLFGAGGLVLTLLTPGGREAAAKYWYAWPLLVIIVVSMTWSENPKETWLSSLDACAALIVIPAMFGIMGAQRGLRAVAMINGLIMVGCVAAVLLLPGRAVHHATDLGGNSYPGAWRGLFLHKNTLGEIAAVALITLLPSFTFNGRGGRALLWLFRLCAIACLVFSKSSNAVIAGAIGILAYLVLTNRKLRHPFSVIAIVVVAGLVVYSLSLSPETLSEAFGRGSTFSGRGAIWKLALQLIGERPYLGHGYGSVDHVFRAISTRDLFGEAVDPHEAFLDVLFDIGFVGLGCLLLILVVATLRGYLVVLRSEGQEVNIAACYISVLAATVVMATAEVSPFRMSGHGTTSFYLAAAALSQLPLLARRRYPAKPLLAPQNRLRMAERTEPAAG